MDPRVLNEKLSAAERKRLSPADFALPKERKYPIQSAQQAKVALTYARWPDNLSDWPEVWKAVKKRWPKVAKSFNGGQFWKEDRGDAVLGSMPHIAEKLNAVRALVAEASGEGYVDNELPMPPEHPDSIAAMFARNAGGMMDEDFPRWSEGGTKGYPGKVGLPPGKEGKRKLGHDLAEHLRKTRTFLMDTYGIFLSDKEFTLLHTLLVNLAAKHIKPQ